MSNSKHGSVVFRFLNSVDNDHTVNVYAPPVLAFDSIAKIINACDSYCGENFGANREADIGEKLDADGDDVSEIVFHYDDVTNSDAVQNAYANGDSVLPTNPTP